MSSSIPVRHSEEEPSSNPSSLRGSEWTEWNKSNDNPSVFAPRIESERQAEARSLSDSKVTEDENSDETNELVSTTKALLGVVESAAETWSAFSESFARSTLPRVSETISAWNDVLVTLENLLSGPVKTPSMDVRKLLEDERISEARELSQRIRNHTSDPLIEHYARVLEPASVKESTSTDHERVENNHAWLSNPRNTDSLLGKWIALDNGNLIATAESPSALLEKVGEDSGYLITQVL